MCKLKTIALFVVLSALCGCSSTPKENITKTISYANDKSEISLQNLNSRAIAYCYSNADVSAEDCARFFESKGYVRFTEIPYKTANYDFLKVDTYPTRRWRDSEITSRW